MKFIGDFPVDEDEIVSLQLLANMAGIPLDILKKELFELSENYKETDKISMKVLRQVLKRYLHKVMSNKI